MDKNQVHEQMVKLGFSFGNNEYPADSEVDKFVALQTLMREWFKYEREEDRFQFSQVAQDHAERTLGQVRDWVDEWLDESIEEFLVG